MKQVFVVLASFFAISQASADPNTCSNPLYCTDVEFTASTPLSVELQQEVKLAVQDQCPIVSLKEIATRVEQTRDSGAVLDTIYSIELAGTKGSGRNKSSINVTVTLTVSNISNPTVPNPNLIQIQGCY